MHTVNSNNQLDKHLHGAADLTRLYERFAVYVHQMTSRRVYPFYCNSSNNDDDTTNHQPTNQPSQSVSLLEAERHAKSATQMCLPWQMRSEWCRWCWCCAGRGQDPDESIIIHVACCLLPRWPTLIAKSLSYSLYGENNRFRVFSFLGLMD